MKYLYILVIAVINYFASIFIGYLVFSYLNSNGYTYGGGLVIAYSINAIIVFFEWLFFKEYLNKIKNIILGNINVLIYSSLFLFPVFYFIYKVIFGKLVYLDTSDMTKVIYYIASNIIIVPVIEELIYRDVLYRVFFKNSDEVVKGIVFISFLFTLTHIASWDINWFYLIHTFFLSIIFFLLRIRYGLLYAILAHSFVNFIWFLLKISIVDMIF